MTRCCGEKRSFLKFDVTRSEAKNRCCSKTKSSPRSTDPCVLLNLQKPIGGQWVYTRRQSGNLSEIPAFCWRARAGRIGNHILTKEGEQKWLSGWQATKSMESPCWRRTGASFSGKKPLRFAKK